MMVKPVSPIDEYILQHPIQVQQLLQIVRHAIKEEMPDVAFEKLSYQMPTFDVYGNCVHFAAAKNHIGFYPAASGISAFEDTFIEKKYKFSKGAVQFPIDKPMPIELIRAITRFRIDENIRKFNEKKRDKKQAN